MFCNSWKYKCICASFFKYWSVESVHTMNLVLSTANVKLFRKTGLASLNCYKQVSAPLIQKGNEKWAVFQQTTCTCYGLGRNSPYRLTCLNTWTPAGGTFFKAVKPLGLGPHRANVSHCTQGFEGYCLALLLFSHLASWYANLRAPHRQLQTGLPPPLCLLRHDGTAHLWNCKPKDSHPP